MADDVREDDVASNGMDRAVAACRERFRPGSGRSSTDLPDPEVTLGSHAGLAAVIAAVPEAARR